MKAKTWMTAAALILVVAATAGCASSSGQSVDKYRWRATHHDKPVSVSVGKPHEFVTSSHRATPPNVRAWRVVVVVTNHSSEPFAVSQLQLQGTSGGVARREVIDPVVGCEGAGAVAPVQPDQTVSFVACWAGGEDPRTVRVSAPGALSPVVFQ